MNISEKVILISGPSGSGKGTVVDEMLRLCGDRIHVSKSATTRLPRSPGDNYYFITREEFLTLMEEGKFLETNLYSGSANLYGTLLSELGTGAPCTILEIDVNGLVQIRGKEVLQPGCLTTVFLVPSSAGELVSRLRGRGSETEESILSRLKAAAEEVRKIGLYDHVLLSDRPAEENARRLEEIIFGNPALVPDDFFDAEKFLRETNEIIDRMEVGKCE